jgi:hypothetical protein
LRQPLNVINDELVDYGNIEYEDIETEVDPTNTHGMLKTTEVIKLMFNPQTVYYETVQVYICKIYLDRVSGYYIDCDLNTNEYRLFCQHPSLERGLVLKLSDDYFLCGNEILSSVLYAFFNNS